MSTGQMIVLPGVVAAGSAPKIDINPSTRIAAKTSLLQSAMFAGSLKNVAAGVSGKSMVTGANMVPVGANSNLITRKAMNGFDALTGPMETVNAAIRMPAGEVSASYCVVAVLTFGPDSATNDSRLTNFLSMFNGNDYSGVLLRYQRNTKNLYTTGHTTGTTRAQITIDTPDTTKPYLVVVDWKNATASEAGTMTLCLNSLANKNAASIADIFAPTPAHTIGFGHPTSVSSLRDSGIHKMFAFNTNMLEDTYKLSIITSLVNALKAEFGIPTL